MTQPTVYRKRLLYRRDPTENPGPAWGNRWIRENELTDLAQKVNDTFASEEQYKTFEIYDLIGVNVLALPMEKKSYLIQVEAPTKCTIDMVRGDTFNVVHHYIMTRNLNCNDCLVLNFANGYNVGGGYLHGAGAQEEMLFYRSTYCHSLKAAEKYIRETDKGLYHDKDIEGLSPYKGRQKFIPFNRCIVSPRVKVYGRFINDSFELDPSKEYMTVPMIAAAGLCTNYMKGDWDDQEEDVSNIYYTLWTTIFLTAVFRGTKHLFIGPIGCGAFAPDKDKHKYIKLVASTLCTVIGIYGGYFETIVFADYPMNSLLFNQFKKVFIDNRFKCNLHENLKFSNEKKYRVMITSQTTIQNMNSVIIPMFL